MPYTSEEKQFIKFLDSYPTCYKKAHVIAENKTKETILPTKRGKNTFEIYDLDDICKSCTSFKEDDISFMPKTTDAIWYNKIKGIFYIYLIEFKGDCLFNNSRQCKLIDVYETILELNNEYPKQFQGALNDLKEVMEKFSDSLLNSLISKPLETVTISIPLIYEEYYEKNKDKEGVFPLDIKEFLSKSRIVYRVVSIADEPNRFKAHSNAKRCSNMSPAICEKYAIKYDEPQLKYSYSSNLKTYHKRYQKAGIIHDADFIDNNSFENFIQNHLKRKEV